MVCTFAPPKKEMKKQILIIEDQLSTRKLLGHYLGSFFQVVVKDSAIEAINWLNEGNKPEAIVTDIIMPDLNGVEFLKQIRGSEQKNIPVIILSSVETSNEKMKCFNLGAKDYVVKPFNPEELRARLNNLIKN
jgi:DNA-binding response OmpR family regulator